MAKSSWKNSAGEQTAGRRKRDIRVRILPNLIRDKSKRFCPAFPKKAGGVEGQSPSSPVATGEIPARGRLKPSSCGLLLIERRRGHENSPVDCFRGGTLAGGSPNKKPATRSPGSQAKRGSNAPSPLGEGVGGEGKPSPSGEGLGWGKPEKGYGENPAGVVPTFAELSSAKQ